MIHKSMLDLAANSFRAWDLKEKKMYRVQAVEFVDMVENRPGIQVFCGTGNKAKWLDVGTFILMKSVGFPDKNGLDIYEGDIEKSGLVVTYLADLNAGLGMNAGWYLQRGNFQAWTELECNPDIEIIGNYLEHPDRVP